MNTKIFLPQNIFAQIFQSEIENSSQLDIQFIPSSLIAKSILEESNSLGLIPTMDLISNKDLFISSKIGISFDALLSNTYIHFRENQKDISELLLKGDITTNEVILCKILFKEFYEVDIKTILMSREVENSEHNMLIVGDENYGKELFLKGLSFSEEIIELINAPYVNFVLASASEDQLKEFNTNFISGFQKGHSEKFKSLFPKFSKTTLDFLSVNIQHLVFDFDEQDIEGIKQLLQLPYYDGMIKEMVEVKFV